MEISGDVVYRASNSFITGNSSMWNNGEEGFSRSSSHREEDEEALPWVALEKLPTYARLRKGLLASTSRGEAMEIDDLNLELKERKELIERLVNEVGKGNEKFLLKLKNRIDRVEIKLLTIEVRFEDLNVEGEAYVGKRALPTFINFCTNIIKKKHLTILHDVSGIKKPGR